MKIFRLLCFFSTILYPIGLYALIIITIIIILITKDLAIYTNAMVRGDQCKIYQHYNIIHLSLQLMHSNFVYTSKILNDISSTNLQRWGKFEKMSVLEYISNLIKTKLKN